MYLQLVLVGHLQHVLGRAALGGGDVDRDAEMLEERVEDVQDGRTDRTTGSDQHHFRHHVDDFGL